MGHVFSQGVLAAPRVVGSRAGVGGDRESHIQILAGASHMLNDCYSPIRGGVGAQGAGARSLRFILGVMAVSALVGGMAGARGLGATLLCQFFFPWCGCLGCSRVGWKGWSCTAELSLLLLCCMHAYV